MKKFARIFFGTLGVLSWIYISYTLISGLLIGIYNNIVDPNIYNVYERSLFSIICIIIVLVFSIVGIMVNLVIKLKLDYEEKEVAVPALVISSALTFIFFAFLFNNILLNYPIVMIFPLLNYTALFVSVYN